MKGAGYYDRHSAAQLSSIQSLQDWVDAGVATLPLPAPPEPITIMDLGSSEGRNAVHTMTTIVEGIRRRTGQPVRTIYSDLASNNFNQLFANLEEVANAGQFPSDVFPGAVAGSFYRPLLPPGTVHFATSFNSIQWLDQLPAVRVPDFVGYVRSHSLRKGRAVSTEVKNAFLQQAEQDLLRFLKCRAREMVSGGKLLLATPGDTDQACVGDGLADVLNDACRDLVADGRLERAEYERVTMPTHFRTLAELLAPLQRTDSPVRDSFAVERAEVTEVPTPFNLEYRRGGDVAAYASAYTGFLRAVSEPVVQAALKRPGGESVVLENLYERVYSRLLADPERYWFRYIVVAVLLTRR
jgi:hypothetical protein